MPAKFPKPSQAVLAARRRRAAARERRAGQLQWYAREVMGKVVMSLERRVTLATQYLQDKVIENISQPVIKGRGPRGGYVVIGRSKPGEFPRLETGQLRRSIFRKVVKRGDIVDGYVGTTLDYGLILEVRMNRSFLRRTLNEENRIIRAMINGPVA